MPSQLWLPHDSGDRRFAYYHDDDSPNNPCTCNPDEKGCKGLYTGDVCPVICMRNLTEPACRGDDCKTVTRQCTVNPDDPGGPGILTPVDMVAQWCAGNFTDSIENTPEQAPEPEPEPEPGSGSWAGSSSADPAPPPGTVTAPEPEPEPTESGGGGGHEGTGPGGRHRRLGAVASDGGSHDGAAVGPAELEPTVPTR